MRKKERWEWIHSWCEDVNFTDKPRVLLVGDSITHNYQEKVREKLKDICYVDYVSTAYAIDSKIYENLVKSFIQDTDYALIHFNNGLHGIHIQKRSYKKLLQKMLSFIPDTTKTTLALSTCVYKEGNKRFDTAWQKRVKERNEVMSELSQDKGYPIDDLYTVSMNISKSDRHVDGTHYKESGYEILATAVAKFIKENL
ncbi:MAG: hypothetical protein IJF76_05640 [Clostridia bacterium]|nr:hypothetical protein [Clostridia bacterium]